MVVTLGPPDVIIEYSRAGGVPGAQLECAAPVSGNAGRRAGNQALELAFQGSYGASSLHV